MKVKLDENMPLSLCKVLKEMGHDIDTVPEENLSGHADPDVWAAAQDAGRLLITQDLDFSDIRKFAPGTHRGIVLVRLRQPGRHALHQRVWNLFKTESVESFAACFVVVTERKLRIHRPKY